MFRIRVHHISIELKKKSSIVYARLISVLCYNEKHFEGIIILRGDISTTADVGEVRGTFLLGKRCDGRHFKVG